MTNKRVQIDNNLFLNASAEQGTIIKHGRVKPIIAVETNS